MKRTHHDRWPRYDGTRDPSLEGLQCGIVAVLVVLIVVFVAILIVGKVTR